jgi:hypothetical protein
MHVTITEVGVGVPLNVIVIGLLAESPLGTISAYMKACSFTAEELSVADATSASEFPALSLTELTVTPLGVTVNDTTIKLPTTGCLPPLLVKLHVNGEDVSAVPGVCSTSWTCLTVRLAVPELAALLLSPGYDAWTVTEPVVAPVTVTEQAIVPEVGRVQVVAEKVTVPVPPVCDHLIVSPEIEPVYPDMVAVQVEVPPTGNDAIVQETVVVVADLMVRANALLELETCVVSPG